MRTLLSVYCCSWLQPTAAAQWLRRWSGFHTFLQLKTRVNGRCLWGS
jgi:hypothetical protein